MTSQDGQMNPSQNQNTIMHGKLKIIHTGSYKLLEWYLDCLYLFIFNLVLRQRLGLQLCWTRHSKETIIYEQAVFEHMSFCWIQITNSAFLITFGFYFLQTTDFVLILNSDNHSYVHNSSNWVGWFRNFQHLHYQIFSGVEIRVWGWLILMSLTW